jgi:hypothetical protein
MTRSDPFPGDKRDPPDLNDKLPLPENYAMNDPCISLVLPLDVILYSDSFRYFVQRCVLSLIHAGGS